MKKPYERLPEDHPSGKKWGTTEDISVYFRTFNRTKTLKHPFYSDGATGARDLGAEEKGWRKLWAKIIEYLLATYFGKYIEIVHGVTTLAWLLHDGFCDDPYWDDGTPISNFLASVIISAILYQDGYKVESILWFFATFLFGGKEIKKQVGWIYVPDELTRPEGAYNTAEGYI